MLVLALLCNVDVETTGVAILGDGFSSILPYGLRYVWFGSDAQYFHCSSPVTAASNPALTRILTGLSYIVLLL